MTYLRILPIQGLFHELSFPERLIDKNTDLPIQDSLLDCNYIFWTEILKDESIKNTTDILKTQPYDTLIPQYKAILKSGDIFIRKVHNALRQICDQANTPEGFFDGLETLSILCKLYSDYVFYPYELTIQNGFMLNEFFSDEITENCLNHKKNPYLDIVNQRIIPIIIEYKPDLLFIEGKINYCNLAIAYIVKNYFSNVHICATRHSSEYYSLSKISDYLLENRALFKVIDSIILEYFDETETKLKQVISQPECSLQNINNIIFIDRATNRVIQTPRVFPETSNNVQVFYRSSDQYKDLRVSPNEVADVRLEPFVKCHWNKCSFCGINKKYSYNDYTLNEDSFCQRLSSISTAATIGIKYIWFIDEAILPEKLKLIAQYIINHHLNLVWQARCRIDKQLLDDELISLLSVSGLKELRMGLESASLNVLRDMKKFDADFSLELVEEIVKAYTQADISIHFPMIIGFPTETAADRQRTYEFLSYLKDTYEHFSFNINIFQLDISSEIFKNWTKYSINQVILPCDAKNFLGNWVAYESQFAHEDLENEQDQFMREKMYPWMPANALLKPHIFYRLSETIRNTLVWKANNIVPKVHYYYGSMHLKQAPNLTIINENGSFLIYNWNNHHFMQGNQLLVDVLNEWIDGKALVEGVENLLSANGEYYDDSDLTIILKKLIFHGYLIEIESSRQNLSTTDFYNDVYQTENYLYAVKPDITLRIWKEYFLVGKVLDLGIGSGKGIDYLLNEGNEVVGVDISKTAIDKLKQRYVTAPCQFIHTDLRTFEIKPNTYSLIICSMVLSRISEKEIMKIAQQIINGLVAGGCVYISDLSEHDPIHRYAHGLRQVINTGNILEWFEPLELITISSTYQRGAKRLDMDGYFGLIEYIGKKK